MLLSISTQDKRQIIDITEIVEKQLTDSKGVIVVNVLHTTAAITTADLDPGTDLDYLEALTRMTPKGKWRHPHDPPHFPDHLWAIIIGSNITIPFADKKLELGTWQRIILIELDGPRERQIIVTQIPARE